MVGHAFTNQTSRAATSVTKRYLCANTEKVIGKFLGIQQGLGARCYDVLCAISSDAIINRANAPKDISAKLVNSELLVDSLNQAM